MYARWRKQREVYRGHGVAVGDYFIMDARHGSRSIGLLHFSTVARGALGNSLYRPVSGKARGTEPAVKQQNNYNS